MELFDIIYETILHRACMFAGKDLVEYLIGLEMFDILETNVFFLNIFFIKFHSIKIYYVLKNIFMEF